MSAAPAVPVLLRARDVKLRLGVSQTWLWRHVRDGSFPRPLVMPGGHRRWRADEVEEWERALPRERP